MVDKIVDEGGPGFGMIFDTFQHICGDDFGKPQNIKSLLLQVDIVNGIVHFRQCVGDIMVTHSVGA